MMPEYRKTFQIEGDESDRSADSECLIRFFGHNASVNLKPFLRDGRGKCSDVQNI